MKAIVITSPGGPEVLQLKSYPKPEAGDGEVLIEVRAAGVNRPDIFQRKGNYPAPEGVPADIPGLEVAGVVTALGANVNTLNVGDKVCALLAGGGYAEYVKVPVGQCLPIPQSMGFIEAASLPETYFTVWTNVFDRGAFRSGESFLIHGGTSGIGVAAIQMVKAMGGTVYATAGSDNKCRITEDLGAKRGINYKTEDFEEIIKQEGGVDVILDMVGGDYTAKNINILKEDGRLVMINAMKGKIGEVDLLKVMRKRLIITGSTLRQRETSFKADIADSLLQHIWPYLSDGTIKPILHETFPLDRASDAHRSMDSGDHIGKIVLEV